MIIVFEIKGKMYRYDSSKVNSVFFIDYKRDLKDGDILDYSIVKVLSKDDEFGRPYLPINLSCEVIGHGKRKKHTIMKYKAKKRNAVKKGFRSFYTKIKINGIV